MQLSDVAAGARSGNVAAVHDETAGHHGDLLAVEMGGVEYTHADLAARAARFAGGLHDLGLEPGDRLLCYLPNRPAFLVAALGAFRAGVVFSPANPQYRARELGYQLRDTAASAVVTHPALRETVADILAETDEQPTVVTVDAENGDANAAERGGAVTDDVRFSSVDGEPTLVERADDDVALQPYTSGTTGRPKGVLLTHRNVRAQTFAPLALPSERAPGETRSLIWLPLYHVTGFTHTAWQPLVFGGSLHLRATTDWDAGEAMRLVEERGITQFVGVTAMYVDVVNHDAFGEHDLTSLDRASEGGAKLPVEVQRTFEEVAGVEMAEGYGLTETNGATHAAQGSAFGARMGTVGQPLRMTDCKVVDDEGREVPPGEAGELLVRGPQVMKGYHDRPEATAAAFTSKGWFRTGDIVRRDADNYYEVVDRKKHVIVTAGYNVYPSEVEELLREHEGVADAAVVGVPDERRNEVPKAFVVPAPGVEPGTDLTDDSLVEFALERVAAYKHPREVEFVDDFPRTTSGKVEKYELREEG